MEGGHHPTLCHVGRLIFTVRWDDILESTSKFKCTFINQVPNANCGSLVIERYLWLRAFGRASSRAVVFVASRGPLKSRTAVGTMPFPSRGNRSSGGLMSCSNFCRFGLLRFCCKVTLVDKFTNRLPKNKTSGILVSVVLVRQGIQRPDKIQVLSASGQLASGRTMASGM